MEFFIQANGITDTKPTQDKLPDREQVEFCKEVLEFIKEKQKFANRGSSYGHKHTLEKSFKHGYISNGAFIQAAKELNMSIERGPNGSPNAYFKFSSDDLKLALLEHTLKNEKISIDEALGEKIKGHLQASQVKTPKVHLYMLPEIYGRYDIKLTEKDLLLLLKDTDLKVNYDFGYEVKPIMDSIGNTKINISLSKLFKLIPSVHEHKSRKRMI